LSLEHEITSQIETHQLGREQPNFNNKVENLTLNVSNLINSIFYFLSRNWSENDRRKLLLSDLECQLLDKALEPWIYKIALRLGLAVAEAFSLVIITGILLPRVFLFFSLAKENEDKRKGENQIVGKDKQVEMK